MRFSFNATRFMVVFGLWFHVFNVSLDFFVWMIHTNKFSIVRLLVCFQEVKKVHVPIRLTACTCDLGVWMNAEAEGCKLIFLWRLLNAENVDVCSNSKLVHSHTCVAREKLYGDFGFETALILKEKDIKDFKNAVLPRSVCVRVGIRNFAKSRVCLTSFDKDNNLTSHHISSS